MSKTILRVRALMALIIILSTVRTTILDAGAAVTAASRSERSCVGHLAPGVAALSAVELAAAPVGPICVRYGTVIINSTNDYSVQISNRITTLLLVIHSQCRLQLDYNQDLRTVDVTPQAVTLWGRASYGGDPTAATVGLYANGRQIGGLTITLTDMGKRTFAGRVTTQSTSDGMTIVRMTPWTLNFNAVATTSDGSIVASGSAPQLLCNINGNTGVTVPGTYTSSHYSPLQLNYTTDRPPLPTIYRYRVTKGNVFPEQSLVQYAIDLYNRQHPGTPPFQAQYITVQSAIQDQPRNQIGYTVYQFNIYRTPQCPLTNP